MPGGANLALTIICSAVTLVVGMFLGVWYGHFVDRPKLNLAGSMGGSSNGVSVFGVLISNPPGILGLNLRRTMIFGKLIHQSVVKGLPVDRKPANECLAKIRDKESGEHIDLLFWKIDNETRQQVTIRSGRECLLPIFARRQTDELRYYIWRPQVGAVPPAPIIGAGAISLMGTRTFTVRIDYSSTRHLEFDLIVRYGLNGEVSVGTDLSSGGGSSF